ncbi:MAG: hypothetical protein ACK4GJ_01000 [bacterium]
MQEVDKSSLLFNDILAAIEEYQKSYRIKFFISLIIILPISIFLSIFVFNLYMQTNTSGAQKNIIGMLIYLFILLLLPPTFTFIFFDNSFSRHVKRRIMKTIFQSLFPEVFLEKYLPGGISGSMYNLFTIETIFPRKIKKKISIFIMEKTKEIKPARRSSPKDIEEDIFILKYRNIPIVMSEIEISRPIDQYSDIYTTVFRGMVYKIPSKYAKRTVNSIPFEDGQIKPDGTVTRLTHNDHTFILVRQNKNSFELPLFKKIDENKLIEFIEEIKEKVEFIINNLETTQNY